jgi:tRNA modification GTPase
VVIAGPPNAGKSSLLNRLAGEQRAIVTDIPGTTRDTLEGSAVVDGIVFNLVDTAGLRDSADEIEQEGMRRARAAFGSADLILLLVEPSTPEDSVRTLLDEGGSAAVVLVRNKIDLIGGTPGRTALQGTRAELRLSVRTGEGIDLLLQVLRETAGAEALDDGVFLARSRHLAGLEQARDCLAQALRENRGAVIPLELLAENLRGAQNALDLWRGDGGGCSG